MGIVSAIVLIALSIWAYFKYLMPKAKAAAPSPIPGDDAAFQQICDAIAASPLSGGKNDLLDYSLAIWAKEYAPDVTTKTNWNYIKGKVSKAETMVSAQWTGNFGAFSADLGAPAALAVPSDGAIAKKLGVADLSQINKSLPQYQIALNDPTLRQKAQQANALAQQINTIWVNFHTAALRAA